MPILEFRGIDYPPYSLHEKRSRMTPEERAADDQRVQEEQAKEEAVILKILIVMVIAGSLLIVYYGIILHLGMIASFIALFSQNPVLAGVANILSILTPLIAVGFWLKAPLKKAWEKLAQ